MMMSAIYYFSLAPGPHAGIGMMANQFLSSLNVRFILIAVPLFIYAAKVMYSGEITEMKIRYAKT
jgi:hypothetical protein